MGPGGGRGMGPGPQGQNAYTKGRKWRSKEGTCPYETYECQECGEIFEADPDSKEIKCSKCGSKKNKKRMTEMSQAAREKLKKGDFVFPDERSWPIHDKKHGKIALIWSTWPQHKEVAKKVRDEVFKKYPDLKDWFKGVG